MFHESFWCRWELIPGFSPGRRDSYHYTMDTPSMAEGSKVYQWLCICMHTGYHRFEPVSDSSLPVSAQFVGRGGGGGGWGQYCFFQSQPTGSIASETRWIDSYISSVTERLRFLGNSFSKCNGQKSETWPWNLACCLRCIFVLLLLLLLLRSW